VFPNLKIAKRFVGHARNSETWHYLGRFCQAARLMDRTGLI
jgi:hypothetical protein